MYQMYIGKVLFPITPGKMSVKVNNQNKTITLIDEGEVSLIKAPGLADISIDELLLPTIQKYPFAVYKDGIFKDAKYYLDKLESWKKKKKPVAFILTRCTPDGRKHLWDTEVDVTIEDYEIVEDADEYGMDVCVKLSMKQYRHWGAKKLVIKKGKKKKSSKKKIAIKKKTRKTKETAKSYTVKKGDTLMNIAKKQLNDSSKWKSIYKLNKKAIESIAKKRGKPGNGYWLFPGTKLKLPKG